MIRFREATTLALTKLRTRKVRLGVTVVISGLLFSILAGASIAARGVFASINDFSEEGLSKRYIVQGSPHHSGPDTLDEKVMDRAVAIHKETIANKKKEAKRLGIEYSDAAEASPVEEYPGPGGSKMRYLNPMHPAAKQALRELSSDVQSTSLDDLKRAAKPYNAMAHYESRRIAYDMEGGRIQVLKGGQESFEQQDNKQMFGPPTGLDSFGGSWTLMSSQLLEPFLLPGQNLKQGADGSVPMIIPVSAAEQLLQLKPLPASASAKERLERIKQVRQDAKSLAFGVCYRNATSASQVEKAVSAQKEIEQNKNKKDYKKPDLQYGLPTEACGNIPVVRDVRNKEQKALDAKQQQFDVLFGEKPAEQVRLNFRVVGIVPDPDYGSAFSVSQIIRSLLTSSLGQGWFSSVEVSAHNPTINALFPNTDPVTGGASTYYAEFASASQAKAFVDKEHCAPDYGGYVPGEDEDPVNECIDAGKLFGLNAYGSNSLGLEDAKRGFAKVFSLAGLGIALIACIIMMGTVGKMIADSRRETAVFRAIGAKKLDIAQIYLLYTIFVSVLVTVFAVLLGLVVAAWAHSRWSAEVTQHAIVTYNAQDLDKVFKLYDFYLPDMLYLLAIAVVAGLLSALIPLFRSLRRNPIRDMRDDT